MFNSQFWQVLINLLFASFGNIQYHIFANCGKIRFIPDVGKFSTVHILPNVDPTCCHFCQSIGFHILQLLGYCQSWNSLESKVKNFILPLLAIYEMQLQSSDNNRINVQVTELPKLALLSPNLAGPFFCCQIWQ